MIKKGDQAPCDMLLAITSNHQAEFETANIDSEAGMVQKFSFVKNITLESLQLFQGHIKCYSSSQAVENWTGVITFNDKQSSIVSNKNLVNRGMTLRNQNYAIGIAVYIGRETKLCLID